MLFSVALLALAGFAAAQDNSTGVTVTNVVSSYVTVCPEPTQFAFNNKTYTVTSATTLTITDCPCTLTSVATPYVVTTSCYVPSYTTYCPVATTVTAQNRTYVATPGQTLTVIGPVAVPTKTTLTPGVPATSLKLVSSSLLSTVVYTPGPSAAVAPAAPTQIVPPKPTAAAFTGAAARNELLGGYLNNLW